MFLSQFSSTKTSVATKQKQDDAGDGEEEEKIYIYFKPYLWWTTTSVVFKLSLNFSSLHHCWLNRFTYFGCSIWMQFSIRMHHCTHYTGTIIVIIWNCVLDAFERVDTTPRDFMYTVDTTRCNAAELYVVWSDRSNTTMRADCTNGQSSTTLGWCRHRTAV